MMNRKKLLIIVTILIAEVIFYFALQFINSNELKHYFTEKNEQSDTKVKSSINTYNLVSETVFSQVIDKDNILSLFAKTLNADDSTKTIVRDSLFVLLSPLYEHLKSINIRQLHFQLSNNESFLRMHRPEKYGDNLTDVRYSIKMTNLDKTIHSGFEEGRIYNGFRYVFPLFYNNQHIGSVETSFSYEAVVYQLKLLGITHSVLALKKDVVLSKVFADEQDNYQSSLFSDNYVIEKQFSLYNIDTLAIFKQIDNSIKNKITDKLNKETNFTEYTKIGKENYLVNFISIKNLENKHVAYIITYEKNTLIEEIINRNKVILIIGLLIIPVFIVLLMYLQENRIIKIQNKKLNQATIELKAKNDELQTAEEELRQNNEELQAVLENLELRKKELEKTNNTLSLTILKLDTANKEILAGINYASSVQKSMLTSDDIIKTYLSEYFLIYKPREIVSGDFYYVNKIENHLIVAVADCTGHGVAGAFITVLGITYLNDAIIHKKINSTNTALEFVRERFKKAFATFGSDNKNGMDIALCALNLDTLILQYSGANLPLWIVRNGELIEHKATRCPIGFYPVEIDFKQNEIQMEKNDIVYMLSDGILDQLGIKDLKKYQKSKFRTLILENSNLSMEIQKQKIIDNFENWKGKNEQTDDVTVLGFKI